MSTYQGPDYVKVKMARFLKDLDTSHNVTLPDDLRREVDWTLQAAKSWDDEQARRRSLAQKEANSKQAVLDADTPLAGKVQCDVTGVYESYRDMRGHRCRSSAKVSRTWTTREFAGLSLDGRPLERGADGEYIVDDGWEIGRGFTKRPINDEERARAERTFKETVHTMNLCGTHRKVKGRYGFPW